MLSQRLSKFDQVDIGTLNALLHEEGAISDAHDSDKMLTWFCEAEVGKGCSHSIPQGTLGYTPGFPRVYSLGYRVYPRAPWGIPEDTLVFTLGCPGVYPRVPWGIPQYTLGYTPGYPGVYPRVPIPQDTLGYTPWYPRVYPRVLWVPGVYPRVF